jgi:hypothetical protein
MARWKHGWRSRKAIEDARLLRAVIELGKAIGMF